MAGVIFKKVSKIYENKTMVIQDFNLEIRDKEFLILVGPSGCGKSTTLRMIAGLEKISSGDLFIDGTKINDVAPKDRDIAMVFQNYALYPHMSVKENMAFSLKLRGVGREEIEKKVLQASEILGLNALLERKPKQLSGGQRQRVAMGRAIVRSPKVFLFDEPLSNLDAKLRVQMRVEIAKLHKLLGTTIVYVTHDQVEAMTLADRIVVMKDGFIQQIGSPLELYEKPLNAFVGAFIGSPSMNQIPAKIVVAQGQVSLQGEDFVIALSGEKAKALENHAGEEVLAGVRPQNIHPKKADKNKTSVLREVEVIEPMGTESYIYFTMSKNADRTWVARCDGMTEVQEGEKAAMVFDIDKVHIFSKDGSKRLA
ncbi:MAG: sn-glycerol-3-phosphate ABC transporter ATP-binding protein UgpC [Candidatus Brocadiae bacterium]|nr:sn-glycerol-3-phosphate ABC transporter ATP-binding protein UgpC [Candidatus Brocadiia bacterium]